MRPSPERPDLGASPVRASESESTNVMACDSESGGGPAESESEKPAGPGWGLYYDITGSANGGSPAEHVPLEQITEA
jgi:hypothetical protein